MAERYLDPMENQGTIDFSKAIRRRVGPILACLLALSVGPPVVVCAQDKAADAGKKIQDYQTLLKDYNTRMTNFSREYQPAKSDEERQKFFEANFPYPEKFAPLFFRFAEANPDHPDAPDALVWILSNAGRSQEAGKAFARISEKYLRSEKLAPVCQSLVYSELAEREKFLRRLTQENPHPQVQASAYLNLGRILMASGNEKEAEATLETVLKKYSDVKAEMRTPAEEAKGELFELRHLALGKVAPQIEGEDVDGKKFKLSDYRGKVVVLDFWGDW